MVLRLEAVIESLTRVLRRVVAVAVLVCRVRRLRPLWNLGGL